MLPPRRTTRQIAEKYKGNLDYYRRPHPLRTVKLLCFSVAAVGSLALVCLPHRQELYSTGPISANHAQFANDCAVCHEGAQPSLLAALRPAALPAGASWSEQARGYLTSLRQKADPTALRESFHKAVDATASMAALDASCLKCHEPMKLHQPQALSLGLRPVRSEIAAAEVSSCSSCHREHLGPARMPPPPSSNCTDCHGNAQQLRETTVLYHTGGHPPPSTGTVQDVRKDDVLRFVPPEEKPHRLAAFAAFRKAGPEPGHPAFGYEKAGMRDPGTLSFNHARHTQSDIPPLGGHALTCTDCHTPGADGAFMQRVNYERHCASCHSLHFSSDVPDIKIPHAAPQKVREVLSSGGLTVLFQDYAVNKKKLKTREEQVAFIQEQFETLRRRGITSPDVLLARVFRLGDPPNTHNQQFPACAKCHQVTDPGGGATPLIAPSTVADRWLARGPFTHASHTHMQCTNCHAGALVSQRTSDILMPPQALCAECHRPLEGQQVNQPFQKVELRQLNPQLVQQQLTQGGISGDCVTCHPRYHATRDATAFVAGAARVR